MQSNTNKFVNWFETKVGKEIVTKKYLHEGESEFEDLRKRVSSICSPDISNEMYNALYNADFFPGGRSLYGAGSKGKFRSTMSNCYIMPMPEDNIESIFDTAKETARIFSMGGGCGINISKLRPNGAKVSNAAKTSTGACSFMEIFDSVGGVIGAMNRRAALILGLNCSHPDIEEFLEVKANNDKIQSANISILFDDEFMKSVRENKIYPLRFTVEATGEEIEKWINAREFFIKFARKNWDFAEPGCLFIDTIREHNLLSGYPEEEYKIEISNPCFTGDMQLLTKYGYFTFEELNGKTVELVSYDGTISKGRVWKSGEKPTFKIRLSNGQSIRCTGDHVFMLNDGTEMQAQNLKGKRIKPFLHERSFDELFVQLGFIQGDGQLSDLNNPSKNGIEINFGKDDADVLELFHLEESDLQANGRSYYTSEYTDIIQQRCFDCEILPNRHMPETYFYWDSNEQLAFLRGMYSANGSVLGGTGNGRITYKTTSPTLATQLYEALKQYGFNPYITNNKPKEIEFGNGKYWCRESFDVNIGSYQDKQKFYNLIGFVQRYKMMKLKDWLIDNSPKVSSVVLTGEIEEVYDFSEPNNHWGVVGGFVAHNCAEYLGNAYNSCNLGSINLYNIVDNPFTKDASINYLKLVQLVNLGVRALDEILDYGKDMQPLQQNKDCIEDWRAIGLGVFGLADMLIALGVRYGSKESLSIINSVMNDIWTEVLFASMRLAREKGSFKKFNWDYIKESPLIKDRDLHYSLLEDIKAYGLRNGSLLSIAPTGSIGTMAGLSGGAEPLFAISYERTTHALSDKKQYFKVYAKSVEHLLKHHGIDPDNITTEEIQKRFPYVVASHDIDPIDRVRVQAVMQYWVDNAISSTVNLKHEATVEDVFRTYMAAWEAGCKGLTVFRDGCSRTAILTTKPASNEEVKQAIQDTNKLFEPTFDYITPVKRTTLGKVNGSTVRKSTACVPSMYVTVNKNKDGEILEVFTNVSQGCSSNIGSITRLTSLALRSGVKVDEIVKEMKSNHCQACAVMKSKGQKVSNSCSYAIAEAIEEAYNDTAQVSEFTSNVTTALQEIQGVSCPECGEPKVVPEGRCFTCMNCGYSKCE